VCVCVCVCVCVRVCVCVCVCVCLTRKSVACVKLAHIYEFASYMNMR